MIRFIHSYAVIGADIEIDAEGDTDVDVDVDVNDTKAKKITPTYRSTSRNNNVGGVKSTPGDLLSLFRVHGWMRWRTHRTGQCPLCRSLRKLEGLADCGLRLVPTKRKEEENALAEGTGERFCDVRIPSANCR